MCQIKINAGYNAYGPAQVRKEYTYGQLYMYSRIPLTQLLTIQQFSQFGTSAK
jgi:hypothetical protein